MEGAIRRVPAMETAPRSRSSSTAPRRSRPTASSSSASPRCPASGWPPASARTASPAPAASARSWPSGSSTASPSGTSGTWTSAASAATTASSATRSRAPTRSCPKYYDIKYPGEERKAGRPLRVSPAYARLAAIGAALRREVRLGARQLVRANDGGRRRVAAPARLGRAELVAGDRRRGARDAPRGRPLRPVQLREARGPRPGRDGVPRAALRQRRRPAGRLDRLHAAAQRARRHRVRPVGDAPRSDRYLLVTGTAFGDHDRAWIERHLPRRRLGARARRDRRPLPCFCVWGPRARDILQPLTRTSLANDDFPYMTARELAVGDVPLLAARVTYVGELGLGALRADGVRARPLGRDLGRRAPSTACAPAATARSTRCGWRRATAPGPAT